MWYDPENRDKEKSEQHLKQSFKSLSSNGLQHRLIYAFSRDFRIITLYTNIVVLW